MIREIKRITWSLSARFRCNRKCELKAFDQVILCSTLREIKRGLNYFFSRIFYFIKKKMDEKLTVYGKGVLFLFVFSLFFINYLQITMIFQINVLLMVYFCNAILFTLYFRTNLIIKRVLPKYCSAHKKLTYTVTIENRGKRWEKGLFFIEETVDPLPFFKEFATTYEIKGKKKKKRHPGLKWFITKNRLVDFVEFPIDYIAPGETKELTVSFNPVRRGYIHMKGVSIMKKDPFSLVKARVFYKLENNILSLPRIYGMNMPQISAHRKYNQGGIVSALKVGNSEEFISLRDYQVGDIIKRIHWKSYAKTQKPVVKEFSDEFFSRYGLILDTFSENTYSDIFEEAVSVAASVISGIELGDSLIDLMFVGTDSYIFTNGRGLSNQERMLEILASVGTCREEQFEMLINMIKGHISLLSSVIIILIDIDEKRKGLLDLIYRFNIQIRIIVIGKNSKEVLAKIEKFEIKNPIEIFEAGKIL